MCITGKTTHPLIQPFIGKYNSKEVWHSYRNANVFDEDILEPNGLRETRFSTYEYVVCMNVPSSVNRGDKFMSSCVGKYHLSAHSGLKSRQYIRALCFNDGGWRMCQRPLKSG